LNHGFQLFEHQKVKAWLTPFRGLSVNENDSGELLGVFQQVFLQSKHAKAASLVIFSREAIRRAGSSGPVTLFPPSPASSREALFEVEPPFAAL